MQKCSCPLCRWCLAKFVDAPTNASAVQEAADRNVFKNRPIPEDCNGVVCDSDVPTFSQTRLLKAIGFIKFEIEGKIIAKKLSRRSLASFTKSLIPCQSMYVGMAVHLALAGIRTRVWKTSSSIDLAHTPRNLRGKRESITLLRQEPKNSNGCTVKSCAVWELNRVLVNEIKLLAQQLGEARAVRRNVAIYLRAMNDAVASKQVAG